MGRSPIYQKQKRRSRPSISKSAVRHREDFQQYVLKQSDQWHRRHLGRLYRDWNEWNECFFQGCLRVPYIILAETKIPRAVGDCATLSGWGGPLQIRIRPSLLRGTHPVVREGREFAEGRYRYVADVLLHEMIHQWQQEVLTVIERGYPGGHGTSFRDKANEIGAQLGLPPVRAHKKRPGKTELPTCASWPHIVRPPDYYLGALARSLAKKPPVTKQVLRRLLVEMESSLSELRRAIDNQDFDDAKTETARIIRRIHHVAKIYNL